MPAPVTFVTGPQVTRGIDIHRRRNGTEKIVMLVKVGQSENLREVELTERELIELVGKAADVLRLISRRRQEGLPLPGSGEVIDQRDVGRIPGDL